VQDYHLEAGQQGEPTSALKAVSLTSNVFYYDLATTEESQLLVQYLAQYVEGFDFWSGSLLGEMINDTGTHVANYLSDTCGERVDTAWFVVDTASCANVNGHDIRVGTQAFLPSLTDADITIPSGFPATPTF
jgi:hypothetical protein